jgi:hypothetical protein
MLLDMSHFLLRVGCAICLPPGPPGRPPVVHICSSQKLGLRCVMKKWSRDSPPAHRGGLLPAQPSQPGCRDEKKLDVYVVYEH